MTTHVGVKLKGAFACPALAPEAQSRVADSRRTIALDLAPSNGTNRGSGLALGHAKGARIRGPAVVQYTAGRNATAAE